MVRRAGEPPAFHRSIGQAPPRAVLAEAHRVVAEESVHSPHRRVRFVGRVKVAPKLIRAVPKVYAVLFVNHFQICRARLHEVAVPRERLVYYLHPELLEYVLEVRDRRYMEI